MLILYYFLGLLLFLLLLTLVPVRAVIRFQEGFALELRYLFLRVPIIPGDEQPLEDGEEKEEEKEEEPAKEKKSPAKQIKSVLGEKGLSGFLQGLGELLRLVKKAVGGIFKKLKLRHFDLYLCLAGVNDPAGAAVRYGQIAAGVYGACGGLFSLAPCRHKGVTVDLNYAAEENVIDFTAELSIVPLFVIKEVLVLLVRGLLQLKKLMGKPKHAGPRTSKQKPAKQKGSST